MIDALVVVAKSSILIRSQHQQQQQLKHTVLWMLTAKPGPRTYRAVTSCQLLRDVPTSSSGKTCIRCFNS